MGDYFTTRLKENKKRDVLWTTLNRHFFQKHIDEKAFVVELGAAWCNFINSIQAGRKIAVDIWPEFKLNANNDVECLVGSADKLPTIDDKTVDVVFASNLVEHLSQNLFADLLSECSRVLKEDGKLILVQPNYRLAFKNYFDDYTHVSIWTDRSIADFLNVHGWQIECLESRFLPMTVKSKMPTAAFLIRVYLKSWFKPFAGQMLIIAKPPALGDTLEQHNFTSDSH